MMARVRLVAAAVIGLAALALAVLWPPIARHNDYVQLLSGGQALLAGLDLYDPASWARRPLVVEQQPPSPIFTYPPWAAVMFVPFALLPVEAGSLLWAIGGLALAVHATTRVARRWSWPALPGIVLASASWPALLVFLQGQWAFALYALAAWCLLAIASRRDALAGIAWGTALLIKPQLFVLGSVVLGLWSLATRRPLIVLTALATMAAGLAVGTIAQPGWLAPYLAHLGGPVTRRSTQQPTLAGLAGDVAGDQWVLAWVAGAIALSVVILLTVRAAVPERRLPVAFAATLTLSIAAAPYSWSYDHYLALLAGITAVGIALERTAARGILLLAAAILFGPLAFALFESAYIRWHDTLSGLVPVLAILLLAAAALLPDRRIARP